MCFFDEIRIDYDFSDIEYLRKVNISEPDSMTSALSILKSFQKELYHWMIQKNMILTEHEKLFLVDIHDRGYKQLQENAGNNYKRTEQSLKICLGALEFIQRFME